MNLQLMVYLLAAFGHEPVEAHDGAEGIEKARHIQPDLILLEIHMPRMDGYEVARILRSEPNCSQIPVVAVTALAMVGDREKILASGFSGYIAKPIDPQAFAAQVQEYLGNRHIPLIVHRLPEAPQHAPTTEAYPNKKLGLVLCVDNTETNLELMRGMLEPSGYKVLAARSVKEGFDLAQHTKPDLIISDVHMPHQDGYDFLRLVRGDSKLEKIPFVFMSASVWSVREPKQAIFQGATKFISKPIEPAELISLLDDCLQKK